MMKLGIVGCKVAQLMVFFVAYAIFVSLAHIAFLAIVHVNTIGFLTGLFVFACVLAPVMQNFLCRTFPPLLHLIIVFFLSFIIIGVHYLYLVVHPHTELELFCVILHGVLHHVLVFGLPILTALAIVSIFKKAERKGNPTLKHG